MNVRRRDLLTLLCGTLVAGTASGRGGSRPRMASLSRLVGDPGQAAAMGRAYLASAPEEGDESFLAAALLGSAGVPGDEARLRASLCAAVKQDFTQGRTVAVEGWILALTEARICALISLV